MSFLAACLFALFQSDAPAPPGESVADLYELGLQAELIERYYDAARPGAALAGDPAAHALLVRTLHDAGRVTQALELLEAPPLEGADGTLLELERARIALREDELDRARGLLQAPADSETPVRYPDQPDAWLLLAKVFARSNQLPAAASLAERFLALAPLHPEAASAWHLRASEALARGDAARAEEHLERMRFLTDWHQTVRVRRLQIRENPDDPLPRYGLGLAFMRVERWNTASALFGELLARFPGHCPAWFQLAEAHRLAGRSEPALEAYSSGIGCDPDDLRPVANRGLLLLELGRPTDARPDLERVAVLAPEGEVTYAPVFLALARQLQAEGSDELRAQDLYARYRSLGGREEL